MTERRSTPPPLPPRPVYSPDQPPLCPPSPFAESSANPRMAVREQQLPTYEQSVVAGRGRFGRWQGWGGSSCERTDGSREASGGKTGRQGTSERREEARTRGALSITRLTEATRNPPADVSSRRVVNPAASSTPFSTTSAIPPAHYPPSARLWLSLHPPFSLADQLCISPLWRPLLATGHDHRAERAGHGPCFGRSGRPAQYRPAARRIRRSHLDRLARLEHGGCRLPRSVRARNGGHADA